MTSFLLAVRLPAARFRARGNDLYRTLLDMMNPYDDGSDETERQGRWSTYSIEPEWPFAYPVKDDADASLIFHSAGAWYSSALRRSALDVDTVRRMSAICADRMYLCLNRNLDLARKAVGQCWVDTLKIPAPVFVEKYATCFNPYLPSALLDEAGWTSFDKSTKENRFLLGHPEQALRSAAEFESRVISNTDPDDVLVQVRCEKAQ